MNQTSFHQTLLNPHQLGDQFEQENNENNKEIDMFFNNSNKRQRDEQDENEFNATLERRTKYKTDILMDETVRKKCSNFMANNDGTHFLTCKNDFTMKQSDNGKRQVLRQIVRDQLFPKMKFINKHELQFSMDPGSVCQFVMTRLTASYGEQTLQQRMEFWNEYKQVVMTKLTQQRNNCIQSLNNVTKGSVFAFCHMFLFNLCSIDP